MIAGRIVNSSLPSPSTDKSSDKRACAQTPRPANTIFRNPPILRPRQLNIATHKVSELIAVYGNFEVLLASTDVSLLNPQLSVTPIVHSRYARCSLKQIFVIHHALTRWQVEPATRTRGFYPPDGPQDGATTKTRSCSVSRYPGNSNSNRRSNVYLVV